MLEEKRPDPQFEACLAMWEICLLGEWDLLVFLHRHRKSLLTEEQISLLVGYRKAAVNQALRRFETAGLVRRSRSSRGVRFYQLVASVDVARQECFELLVNLFAKPPARGLVAGRLLRTLTLDPALVLDRGPEMVRGLRRQGLYLT